MDKQALRTVTIPRMALDDNFCVSVVNTEMIKAAGFDNEVTQCSDKTQLFRKKS